MNYQKTTTLVAAALITLIFQPSCSRWFTYNCTLGSGASIKGSGIKATRTVTDLAYFDTVSVTGKFTINFVQGEKNRALLEGDDNIIALATITQTGSQLRVDFGNQSISTKIPLVLTITTPMLKQVTSSGAVVLTNTSPAQLSDLSITSSGSSTIKLNGSAESLTVRSSGSSTIDTEHLKAKAVTIDASGSTQATVYASEKLAVSISGAGNVRYSGNPQDIHQEISGIGSVRRI